MEQTLENGSDGEYKFEGESTRRVALRVLPSVVSRRCGEASYDGVGSDKANLEVQGVPSSYIRGHQDEDLCRWMSASGLGDSIV